MGAPPGAHPLSLAVPSPLSLPLLLESGDGLELLPAPVCDAAVVRMNLPLAPPPSPLFPVGLRAAAACRVVDLPPIVPFTPAGGPGAVVRDEPSGHSMYRTRHPWLFVGRPSEGAAQVHQGQVTPSPGSPAATGQWPVLCGGAGGRCPGHQYLLLQLCSQAPAPLSGGRSATGRPWRTSSLAATMSRSTWP